MPEKYIRGSDLDCFLELVVLLEMANSLPGGYTPMAKTSCSTAWKGF